MQDTTAETCTWAQRLYSTICTDPSKLAGLSAETGSAHILSRPARLVCVGVAALIGGQALLNLGIATGMLPVTGLPLPLVSYGGSSVLATMAALGCVLDIGRRKVDVFFEE